MGIEYPAGTIAECTPSTLPINGLVKGETIALRISPCTITTGAGERILASLTESTPISTIRNIRGEWGDEDTDILIIL